ncbi:hypothetical protein DLAC_05441 [Tieghemostelium lacteum]|uniref:Uncharacterized protein n=1 Tax=Tieghemostelium lacteum TaxID=361077 RepID=A0A151ZG63_TIELA|nr:hypothetical protein DLAC_05441 [Tieghemostelium lacteum]|eukprot:KYQ92854.1 hypothetical protein DLAC_05441 [Tieghemostelium lacteum]
MSFFNSLKQYIPKRIQQMFAVPGEGMFFDTSYRFPAPGSQTPPEVSNKFMVKTRPLTRIYRFLKKRGEVLSMRPQPKYLGETTSKPNITLSDELQKDIDFYEKPAYPITPPRITSNKLFFKVVTQTKGFDVRNIKSLERNRSEMVRPGGVPKYRNVFEFDEYDIDSLELNEKKLKHSF